jgi:hypothetical protein
MFLIYLCGGMIIGGERGASLTMHCGPWIGIMLLSTLASLVLAQQSQKIQELEGQLKNVKHLISDISSATQS